MHPVTLKPVPDSQDGVSGHHFVANRVRFPSCWQLKISWVYGDETTWLVPTS